MSPNMQPKIVLFVCGSFNPPTNMHLRMFEVARDYLHHMGREVIGAIASPVHDAYGKHDLISSTHRVAMLNLALKTSDWIKLSDWECTQENWTRTRLTLEHHQNQINAAIHCNNIDDLSEKDLLWLPDKIRDGYTGPVQLKLLCGADLLESFKTPGLWSDDDMESIVGQHGLVVVTREQMNPLEFIYQSDMLTKYMANIAVVTEWFKNEISSTKVRRCLRRGESIKYLIADDVITYIHSHGLYASKKHKYVKVSHANSISAILTPSPSDIIMQTPSPQANNCLSLCHNNLFLNQYQQFTLDQVDGVSKTNAVNAKKHPGQAVKIATTDSGGHQIIDNKEVRMKSWKSCTVVSENIGSNGSNLKDSKSCDENPIKFIFTRHGIQVISDVETIV